MEFRLPPIASKDEIQKFISNLKSFAVEAEHHTVPKDILAPISYTVIIFGSPKETSEIEARVAKIQEVQNFASFLGQSQLPQSLEIPFSSISKQIVNIMSSQIGAKLCFAAFVRSLSLLVQFLLTKEQTEMDRVNKNLAQKAVDLINALPVKSLFYPELYQHPFQDLGFLSFQIASPTAACISKDKIYVGSADGVVTMYLKNDVNAHPRFLFRATHFHGMYSLISKKNKIYLIYQNQKCAVYKIKKNLQTHVTIPLTYPTISDGFYYYCVIFDMKTRVRIFNQSFERVRKSVKLHIPSSIELSNEMAISTNGSFINFISKNNCYIFSLITGKYISTERLPTHIHSITYDYTFNSFLCISNDGLVEIQSRATVPPWMLNYNFGKSEASNYKDMIMDALSTLSIQYVGGGNDIPLSTDDESCIASLLALLSSFLKAREFSLHDDFSGEPSTHNSATYKINESAIITCLNLLQVKIRRYNVHNDQFENILLNIFTKDCFKFARRSASFLFLSNLLFFEKNWNQNYSTLLSHIIDESSCRDNVFYFLPLFSFNVPFLNEELFISIINLTIQTNKAYRLKATIILSTLQNYLVENLPKTESAFTTYVTHLMIKMSEQWTAFLSSSAKLETSICFNIVKKLELLIMKNINKIELPLIVTERLFAVSIMQQMASDEQNLLYQQIFNRLLYLALHFAFKAIETDTFVVCNGKINSNHDDLNYDGDDQDEKVLYEIANKSNWSDISVAKEFIQQIKGKISHEQLLERKKEIDPIQPQPLRKISHFLLTGQFNSAKLENSAIYQLINYAQWIPNSFTKLIFALFIEKIERFQDDFLCIPQDILEPFVEKCPITLLLPNPIIAFSKFFVNVSNIDFFDLAYSVDKVIEIVSPSQSREFIKPFLELKSKDETQIHRTLLLALIGFKKGDVPFSDLILEKLKHCICTKQLCVIKIVVEIVKIYAFQGEERIFDFIIDIIGNCVLKRSEIFPNAKSVRVLLQFAFHFVEFARILFNQLPKFRKYLTSGITNNPSECFQLAFFTIVNNLIAFPIVGCRIIAYDSNWNNINSIIYNVKKNGHVLVVDSIKKSDDDSDNNEKMEFDIRTLKQYVIVSPNKVDILLFDDIDGISNFFNNYTAKTQIESILFFTSLECLCNNEKFAIKFDNIEKFTSLIEPSNDKCAIRHFWEFYSQAVSYSQFDLYQEAKERFLTSPFPPTIPFAATFNFSALCEVGLICFFPTAPYGLEYLTVSFADSFSFNLDPDSQQISMTSSDKAVTYPIYHSALYYALIIKAKNLSFKIKKSHQSLDKLNSFDFYDFSSFVSIEIGNPKTVISESFQESYLATLSSDIRNMCLKSIVPKIMKVKHVREDLCAAYIHTCLSNFSRMFLNSKPIISSIDGERSCILQNADTSLIIEHMMQKLNQMLLADQDRPIWRNNFYARPVKKNGIIEDCVIVGSASDPTLIRFVKEKTEVEEDCFVLPRDHLNRSSIEVLMYAKNLYLFCRKVGDSETAAKVAEIMRKCEKEQYPGFTGLYDLKSVDILIKEVDMLYIH